MYFVLQVDEFPKSFHFPGKIKETLHIWKILFDYNASYEYLS